MFSFPSPVVLLSMDFCSIGKNITQFWICQGEGESLNCVFTNICFITFIWKLLVVRQIKDKLEDRTVLWLRAYSRAKAVITSRRLKLLLHWVVEDNLTALEHEWWKTKFPSLFTVQSVIFLKIRGATFFRKKIHLSYSRILFRKNEIRKIETKLGNLRGC